MTLRERERGHYNLERERERGATITLRERGRGHCNLEREREGLSRRQDANQVCGHSKK